MSYTGLERKNCTQMGDGVSFYFYKRLNCRGQTIFLLLRELIDPWRIQGFGYKTQSRTVVFFQMTRMISGDDK
jgi:hypothetical protein